MTKNQPKSDQEWLSDISRLSVKQKTTDRALAIVDSLDPSQEVHEIKSSVLLTIGSVYREVFPKWLMQFIFIEDTTERYTSRSGFKKYRINHEHVALIREQYEH